MADARKNRDKLMSMMAMSEEITRTNNKIYRDLSTLAENPEMKDNLYNSIDDLAQKVNRLKETKLGDNFIEQEEVLLAPQSTLSPQEDITYKAPTKQNRVRNSKKSNPPKQVQENPITPEEETYNEELEEATNTPQPPVPPKRNVKKNTRQTRKTRQRLQKKNFSNLGKGEEGTQQD